MLGQTTYEPRYCAYVDILGFSQLIEDLNRGTISFEALRDVLATIHRADKGDGKSWHSEFRAQSISDAVAISTVVNSIGLVQIFNALELLTERLLAKGYFLRGALVKGQLYHDEQMVFGEALVKAFRLESEIVRFPRIMATREIALDIEAYSKSETRLLFDASR